MSNTQELSQDTTALAQIVIDPVHPAEVRAQAWGKLIPTIEAIARQATRPHPESADDAVGAIWELLDPSACGGKNPYDPTNGSFCAWCRVVLYRRALDRARRRGPLGGAALPIPEVEDPAGMAEEWAALLMERRERLRESLDRLSSPLEPTRGVDYFAVLLVQLRLAMARRAGPVLEAECPARPPRAADFIAWCVPWTRDEHSRSFKPGWPQLCVVWGKLEDRFDRPPFWVAAGELCACIDGTGAVLTPDLWNHWVTRAKVLAREVLGAEAWIALFADFLPDRPVRPRDSEGGSTP